MSDFMGLMESWDGYRPLSDVRLSEAAMARALDLISGAGMPLHRQRYLLQEAITTADFPILFGGILDRQMLALYKASLPNWPSYVPRGTLTDFRVATLHKMQGNQQLLGLVAEKAEYPITPMSEGHYDRQLFKRGRKFDISWEAIINDAFGAFGDMAARFANAALYTESWMATSIYASAAGPNVLLFGAPIVDPADAQNVTNQGVLPLTIQNLEITLSLMARQADVQGRPLGIRGAHLVVPPQLEWQARSILTSALKQMTEVGAGAGIPVPTANIMSQIGLQLHVDPLLPVIDGTATNDTTWYLFADQSQGTWGQMEFLRGHETPEICMKASNKVSLTGAPIGPFEGDFDTDDILWRVRHVLGGSPLDGRFAYVQVGP